MVGYQAINPINSYWQTYGNYPNYGQPQMSQYVPPSNSTQYAMDSYVSTSNNVVEDKTKEVNRKKRKKTAIWIAGGLITASIAAAILFPSKNKGNKLWSKIKGAASTCWNGVKKKFPSGKSKKVAEEQVVNTVEMIQKNGKTTLRLQETAQNIHGKTQNIIAAANDLGIDDVARGLKDATSKVKTSRMIINDNGVEKLVTLGKSGQIYCKANGKIVNLSEQSPEFQKLVKETVESIKAKDLKNISSKVKLENVVYDSKIVDGTFGTYISKGRTATNNNGLLGRIVTDRFDVKSTKVRALMDVDKNLAEAVVEAAPEGRHWYGPKIKPKYDAWKVRTATHTPKVKNWPAGTQILIEDNKISGIMQGGKVFGLDSENYHALHQQFPKAFDNVLEKKLDNVVRYLP